MKASNAALLTTIALIAILVLAWYARRGQMDGYHPGPSPPAGGPSGPFGPQADKQNISLYDHPYTYPAYEGRETIWWDGDHHCAANCQRSPCVAWCR